MDKMVGADAAGEQVVCSKCGTANPSQGRKCLKCNAHLHRRCSQCLTRNLRSAKVCVKCGKSLEKGALRRLKHQLNSKKARRYYRIARHVFAAIVLFILLAFGLYFLKSGGGGPVAGG
jgi:ribosomal protein L40E